LVRAFSRQAGRCVSKLTADERLIAGRTWGFHMADTPISITVRTQSELLTLRHLLSRSLQQRGCSAGDVQAVVLAAHEAAKNGLRFSGDRPVDVTLRFEGDQIAVCVADSGPGFEHDHWRGTLPDVRQTSGRGLHLMHGLMDCVDVVVEPAGCVVRMAKRLRLAPATGR
jgi:anti-sigma regulatory factor (Ser/Thr protein kinase)